VRRRGLDVSGSGWGQVSGSCEHCNETLGSIKGREFLYYVWLFDSKEGLCSMEILTQKFYKKKKKSWTVAN
jgi:hypothetical protein